MATRNDDNVLARAVAEVVHPLTGGPQDFDSLLDLVGGARIVLIGEATHGTHEFYLLRAQITKRLIVEKGFAAVAAEADWPDAYRVNEYVRGLGADQDAVEALGDFRRFPAWMWRNADVLDFVGWLRTHNDRLDARGKVGFYGLDLYSLQASIVAVLAYLDRLDPEAAARARARYACFENLGADPHAYGYATSFGLTPSCEREVIAQLVETTRLRASTLPRGGFAVAEQGFEAEQNARVIRSAEQYYRSMFTEHSSSWNLRDTHLADTMDALLGHMGTYQTGAKLVVWAHNSHVGDARATQMGEAGELNLGQLARQRHPGDVRLIGFSTYGGTVTAASDWGGPADRKKVRPALPGSYEDVLHRVGLPGFLLHLSHLGEAAGALRETRLQRAIGVIYRPDTERASHYFRADLPRQFDAVVHLDQTRALEPLERTAEWTQAELAETFPTGM